MTVPDFRPHLLLRGGHQQTLATVMISPPSIEYAAQQHVLSLPDGDQIVLHDDRPEPWRDSDPILVVLHGLCGCHGSSYMIRLADKFSRGGVRVVRIDMRGCGAGRELARELPHSGRSEDLYEVINFIGSMSPGSPVWITGVSMGGNIVLKTLGEIAKGILPVTESTKQIARAAAIAPPIDPARCCKNLSRPSLRPYGWYFIRQLRRSVPSKVAARADWKAIQWTPMPRTLWDFDDLVTAPLSGYDGVEDYYRNAASAPMLADVTVPTLILGSQDDPIIPVGCFHDARLSETIQLELTRHGGHVGFIGPRPLETGDRRWMDLRLLRWFGVSTP